MFPPYPVRRFSVDEFHRLIERQVIDEDDRIELLEGWLVPKMTHNPLHDGTLQIVAARIQQSLLAGWVLRIQSAVTLPDSEPEPDLAVVRGTERTYLRRHPGAEDIGLIVEIAGSSLDQDRQQKSRIYARAGIATYWIVNLTDLVVEAYSQPTGAGGSARYAETQVYRTGDSIPLRIDGTLLANIPAIDLLPG